MRSCVAHYKTESGNNCTATEITQCSGSMTLIDFKENLFIYFKKIKIFKENLIKNPLIAGRLVKEKDKNKVILI